MVTNSTRNSRKKFVESFVRGRLRTRIAEPRFASKENSKFLFTLRTYVRF